MPLFVVIKVVPSAGKVAWKLDKNGTLKCYLKSPPEQGKANKELQKLLTQALKIPSDAVTIVQGATSRVKRLKIDVALSWEDFLSCLGVERQLPLL